MLMCLASSCISNMKQVKTTAYSKYDKSLKETYLMVTDNFHLNEYKANSSYTSDWISLENFIDGENRPFEIRINSDQLKIFKNQLDPTRKYSFGIFKSVQTQAGKKVQNFELTNIIDSRENTLQNSSFCSLHRLQMQRGVASIENGYDYPNRVDIAGKKFPNNGVIYSIDSSYDSAIKAVWICPKCSSEYKLWQRQML